MDLHGLIQETMTCFFAAADFVSAFQKRQGLYISCIEEIAYKRGFIDKEQLVKLAQPLLKNRLRKVSDGDCRRVIVLRHG